MTSSGEDTSVDSAEQSPAAAEAIAGNEDLLGEILLRLPVKSLFRFESVSKRWLFLICNPHFAQSHTRRHNPNLDPSGLLLNHEYAGFQFAPFNHSGNGARIRLSNPNDPHLTILQSCNGLLLCRSTIFSCFKENVRGVRHYLCNPANKQFNAIRFNSKFEDSLDAINLAFDPLKSPYFKLILIRNVNGRTPHTHRIDIYSSETRSLTRPTSGSGHRLTFTAPPGISLCDSVCCNGAIHWNSDGETSLYFDTHTERLNPMPMPPFGRFDDVRYFGESRGHLHIVIDKNSATEFDIWELKADYSGWLVKYRVNLDAVMVRFRDVSWNLQEKCEAFSHCVLFERKKKRSQHSWCLYLAKPSPLILKTTQQRSFVIWCLATKWLGLRWIMNALMPINTFRPSFMFDPSTFSLEFLTCSLLFSLVVARS